MENILEDILNQLIEDAIALKQYATDDFEMGKLMGYYFAISNILSQAVAFDVFDKLSTNLQKFNPESLIDEIK